MAGFVRGAERVLADTPLLKLVETDLTLPDGETVSRLIVHHPGAVAVVPIDADGNVVLLRQYRVVFDREIVEIPAGKRDVDGEPAEATAQRELAEEIGFEAGSLEHLTTFLPTPGFCDEMTHVFLGTDLRPVGRDVQTAEEAHMTIERWRFDDAVAAVTAGEITDAKTIIGLLLAAGRR